MHLSQPLPTQLYKTLSIEEKKRAEHYHAPRAVLRDLLGKYLKKNSHEIIFLKNTQGKPYVKDSSLHFNISHAKDLALLAFANQSLGIDIEWKNPQLKILPIAKRFFTIAEHHRLLHLPNKEQWEYFYHLWTKKEAYTKACGGNLLHNLKKNALPMHYQSLSVHSEYSVCLATSFPADLKKMVYAY